MADSMVWTRSSDARRPVNGRQERWPPTTARRAGLGDARPPCQGMDLVTERERPGRSPAPAPRCLSAPLCSLSFGLMEPSPRPRGSYRTSDRDISCASFWLFCVPPAGFHLRQRKAVKLPIRCRAIHPAATAAPTFPKRANRSPRAARGPWRPARAAHLLKARKDKHLPACRRLPRDLPRPSSIRPLLRGVEADELNSLPVPTIFSSTSVSSEPMCLFTQA
jgi:hypothetical protein